MTSTSSSTASRVAHLTTSAATAHRVADIFAEQFETLDAAAAVFEDAHGDWSVALHFREPPNETAVRALVAMAAGAEAANALVFETVAAKDWVDASLAGLPPVDAGRFVVHGRHCRDAVGANRIGIEIEAALAFGTGHHGTTRGCLLALDHILKRQKKRRLASSLRAQRQTKNILDIGTGSGVLAIAAARALHAKVLASDSDPLAVRIAHANARLNRVGIIEFICARGLAHGRFRARAPFDLVFANILLKPVVDLATPMRRLLAPGARVVLSGLLVAHGTAALNAYVTRGLALDRRITLGGWVTLLLRRR